MKRAYIVVGPESAGNRLMTAILIRAGCSGNATVGQPHELPLDETPVVIHRSFPFNGEWPNLAGILRQLRLLTYHTIVIVLTRDEHCLVESQQRAHGHRALTARLNISEAYERIFAAITQELPPFTVVPMESLILHPVGAVAKLLERLDLPPITEGPLIVENSEYDGIQDVNAKHYAPREAEVGA